MLSLRPFVILAMNFDEQRLRDKNEWKSVAQAPNLPFRTHTEIRNAVANRIYALDISYIAARQLAPFVRSYGGRTLNLLLTVAPFVTILAVIVLAFWQWNFLLLLGVPVAVLGAWFGHPMNPLRRLVTAVTWILFLATIAVWNQTFTILVAAWIVPVVSNRAAYGSNLRALRNAVLQSEALFLNQYSQGAVRLRNVATGAEHVHFGFGSRH
jgi:hypothetical protein